MARMGDYETNNLHQMFVYVPNALYREINKRAKKENIGLSTCVRKILIKEFNLEAKLFRRPYLPKQVKKM